jgi:hypothetical protein
VHVFELPHDLEAAEVDGTRECSGVTPVANSLDANHDDVVAEEIPLGVNIAAGGQRDSHGANFLVNAGQGMVGRFGVGDSLTVTNPDS